MLQLNESQLERIFSGKSQKSIFHRVVYCCINGVKLQECRILGNPPVTADVVTSVGNVMTKDNDGVSEQL